MNRFDGISVIVLTFVVASVLSLVVLPNYIEFLRPEWVALLVVYWVIAIPHRIGVLIAWCVGICQDILLGAVLGQHALALAVVAYITFILHMRIRVFPLWQQCMSVLLIVGVYLLVVLMVERTVMASHWTIWYWLPALSSAVVWPWVMLPLRWVRKHYDIN